MQSIALYILLESVIQFAEENKYKTNAIWLEIWIFMRGSRNFSQEGPPAEQGWSNKFYHCKTHILENRGGLNPLSPTSESAHDFENQRTNGPVNAHLISWPSKAQNIQNLENIW